MSMNFKDRYYGVEYFGVLQFYAIPVIQHSIVITPYFTTLIELRSSSGGLKHQWYYTQDVDNPIQEISVEMTSKGCGICKVTFAELNFPIEASDVIRVRFNGSIIYEGLVDNDVDISNPVLTASPLWKRFEELTFSGQFNAGTQISNALQSVVSSLCTDSQINWNPAKINLISVPPNVQITYLDSKASDILQDLLTLAGEMHYWGVDTNRDFFVKRYDDTALPTFKFFAKDQADFESVKITEDYSKITMTQASIYKKVSGGGTAVYVGSVGEYGNVTYPPLSISNKIRKKMGKVTASEYVTDTQALVWGYESLKHQLRKALTIEINNINIKSYMPFPDAVLLAEGDFSKDMFVAVTCDSLTPTTGLGGFWSNASIVQQKGKNLDSAVRLFLSAYDTIFDFGRVVNFYRQQKVGFYITGAFDTTIQVAFSQNASPSAGEFFNFALVDNNLLGYYDFNITSPFRYIYFKYVSGNIYVDDIQVFCEAKRQAVGVVNKVSMKWSSAGLVCNATCGNISNMETKELEDITVRIKALEAINNIG